MKTVFLALIVSVSTGVILSACQVKPNDTPLPERLQRLDADLKIGDRGPSVRTVHDYLTAFGYYPNDDLAAQFPNWRPYIANPPSNPDVFDEDTASAVRRLQVSYGLPVTGIVDSQARAAMKTPRCGVPDGMVHPDPSDKFSTAFKWSITNIPYSVDGTSLPSNIDLISFQTATQSAFNSWAAQTSLTFSTGGTGGTTGAGGAGGFSRSGAIAVRFATVDGPGGLVARTSQVGTGEQVTLDVQETWSLASQTPANAMDLQSVLLHEVGHALGLFHSAFDQAVMFPTIGAGAQRRATVLDDQLGISALYDTYVQLPGTANDIGVGADGSVWIIGNTTAPGGFTIHKWNGTGWDLDSGGSSSAIRISVGADGSPWVVNNRGDVWHKSTNSPFSGSWQLIPGVSASDIGASAGGVWAVSTTLAPSGGGQIYQLVGNQWVIDNNGNTGALRIAVDDSGTPWITQQQPGTTFVGAVLKKVAGQWTKLERIPSMLGSDIAVPPGNGIGGSPWAVGISQPFFSQGSLFLWHQQPAVTGPDGSSSLPLAHWDQEATVQASDTPSSIAVDSNGQPWYVDPSGRIFTANR